MDHELDHLLSNHPQLRTLLIAIAHGGDPGVLDYVGGNERLIMAAYGLIDLGTGRLSELGWDTARTLAAP